MVFCDRCGRLRNVLIISDLFVFCKNLRGLLFFLNFSKVNSLFYSRVILFYMVSGASLAKTPGSQIWVRVCFGAPGAAELWHTWIGDLALDISVGAN